MGGLRRFLVIVLLASLLSLIPTTSFALSRAQLERGLVSDVLPEYRVAAGKALSKLYIEGDVPTETLKTIAIEGRSPDLRRAAAVSLGERYRNVSGINKFEEIQQLKDNLLRKARSAKNENIRYAASQALIPLYVSFSLNEISGYSTSEIESLMRSAENDQIRELAVEVLSSVYPAHRSHEELLTLIKDSSHPGIRHAASEALSELYASPMFPSPSLEELRERASNEDLDPLVRQAAGGAFGLLAPKQMSVSELSQLSKSAPTAELQRGAGEALGKALIESKKTKNQLLRMAAAATGWAPQPYRDAIAEALSDRMLPNRR